MSSERKVSPSQLSTTNVSLTQTLIIPLLRKNGTFGLLITPKIEAYIAKIRDIEHIKQIH